MIFNSFQFLWLFPVIFITYHVCSRIANKKKIPKASNYILLIISYLLYAQWNPAYTLILLGVTLCTYLSAIIIEKQEAYGKKKYIIYSAAILTLLPLIVFKYYDFIIGSFKELFAHFGITLGLQGLNWAIPLGLSFFTFQAIGYLWDVYYRKMKAEHNLADYMLFISFFPQIMSGPISKAQSLLPQIKAERTFDYSKAVQGCKWLLWGFFLKTVMADRLGVYVDTVYSCYELHSGLTCFVASIFYSLQIYGDFAGYSLMAIGVGRLLGFDLINNFNRPYFSASITEFWRRWHISLSLWLKDYVYIPLGGSRCSKLKCYRNILLTFLVSGIWHGANWTFILWGTLHGAFQIIEKALNLQKDDCKGAVRVIRILATFMLVNFAWIFFRMPDIHSGLDVCRKIFTDIGGSFFVNAQSIVLGLFAASIVFVKECFEESGSSFTLFNNRHTVVRWLSYTITVILILLLGVFDSTQFIYVNF